ncbi:MAG: hypothetical protein Kapaf2KO_07540 [Candidatus Kapaibacteriales bacterium]
MIAPEKSKIANKAFKIYLNRLLSRHFSSIKVSDSVGKVSKDSVLMIQNHFSWWDGFVAYYVNDKIFQKDFHITMLSEQLSKYTFFKKLGAIGIDPSSPKSLLGYFKFSTLLLNEKDKLLVFYPQGKIEMLDKEIRMSRGLQRLLKDNSEAQLVGCHAHIEYGNQKKPTLFISIFKLSSESIVSEYNLHKNDHLAQISKDMIFS